MSNPDPLAVVEKTLQRLIPAALSQSASTEMEAIIDELAGHQPSLSSENPTVKWSVAIGIAAAVVIGMFVSIPKPGPSSEQVSTPQPGIDELTSKMAFLAEANRVENVSDEGLFIDAGGSAVRKVRVRVVEESSVRDEETGIVVQLSEPREEVHLLPVSTF